MKFIISVILTALLGFAIVLFLGWWTFAITSFIVAMVIPQKAGPAFLSAFLGIFLLWFIQVSLIDSANEHLLSTKVAFLFPLSGSYFTLTLITAFLGGLISGFAGLTAGFLHPLKRKSDQS